MFSVAFGESAISQIRVYEYRQDSREVVEDDERMNALDINNDNNVEKSGK